MNPSHCLFELQMIHIVSAKSLVMDTKFHQLEAQIEFFLWSGIVN